MFKLRLNMVAMLPVRAFSRSPTQTGKRITHPFDLWLYRACPAESYADNARDSSLDPLCMPAGGRLCAGHKRTCPFETYFFACIRG